jgi:hypothetical protein
MIHPSSMAQNQLGREGLSDPKHYRPADVWLDLLSVRVRSTGSGIATDTAAAGVRFKAVNLPCCLTHSPAARQTFKVASGGLCNQSSDKLLASFGSTVPR